jgi:hypothetical protein
MPGPEQHPLLASCEAEADALRGRIAILEPRILGCPDALLLNAKNRLAVVVVLLEGYDKSTHEKARAPRCLVCTRITGGLNPF